jgi:hypothetical protein
VGAIGIQHDTRLADQIVKRRPLGGDKEAGKIENDERQQRGIDQMIDPGPEKAQQGRQR